MALPTAIVFGPWGLLGSHLGRVLRERFEVWTTPLDIRLGDEVFEMVAQRQADVVVNCAAMTNLDDAEEFPHRAMSVNCLGAANVALAAENVAATLVHFSTGAVFDALDGEHDETTIPRARGAYSLSKLAGEAVVQRLCSRLLLVRTADLYGAGGRNSASNMLAKLTAGDAVEADHNRLVTPTWAHSLAVRTLQLLDAKAHGIVHASSPKPITWYKFAQGLLERVGRGSVEPMPMRGKAPRPMRSTLVETTTPPSVPRMPTWQEDMRDYLNGDLSL